MTIVDQAEVRETIAPWAHECVGYERAGHKGLYLAALAYQEAYRDGLSQDDIAREVAKAGFRVHQTSVSRRLRAIEGLSVTLEPSSEDLELFAERYGGVNNPLTSSKTNEWYTPVQYIDSARAVMGGIDLDPASCEQANETVQAKDIYTLTDSGLDHDWHGRVWMNPPWGNDGPDFGRHLIGQHRAGNVTEAVALFNAHATDTDWFQPYFEHVMCFTDHRIDYDSPEEKTTTSTHGSVFVYLGDKQKKFGAEFLKWGAVMARWPDV